ncbi:Dihydroorotate dehydrogenase (quinone) [Azospirillaceae bacterium]
MLDPFRLIGPVLRSFEAERAHHLTITALKSGLVPNWAMIEDDPCLSMRLWGLTFPNPVGMAAGFDKNAEVIDPLLQLGFGFVEAGTVTPKPQSGNPQPRIFRLPECQGMINRLGFNNQGLEAFAARLAARAARSRRSVGLVGANVGRNKETPDEIADYEIGLRRLAPFADYLVINISSPNTPGLRTLQGRGPLTALLERALKARAQGLVGLDRTRPIPPLLVKIAPDLSDEDLSDIAEVALASGIDGLIISNTTVSRTEIGDSPNAAESGGLSGKPLFVRSTALIGKMHRLLSGRLPIIGVGGVASPDGAYAKIRAGASLIQLYTALVYQGPLLVARIKSGLVQRLRADGFSSLAQAVGVDAPK